MLVLEEASGAGAPGSRCARSTVGWQLSSGIFGRPGAISVAISSARRSAFLAPRCQAAGGGESMVISSLGDFWRIYSWNAQYRNTIIGGYLWHDWKVDNY